MNNTVYYDPPFLTMIDEGPAVRRTIAGVLARKEYAGVYRIRSKTYSGGICAARSGNCSASIVRRAYADILAKLKPGFIHHPESKRLISGHVRRNGL